MEKYKTLKIFAIVVLVFIISICVFNWFSTSIHNTERVRSKIDGEYYSVHRKEDRQLAADTMAKLNQDAITLLHCMRKYQNSSNPELRQLVRRLFERYNPDSTSIVEHLPNINNDTSYNLDKGKKTVMCLRKDNEMLHDYPSLQFVFLHELAHTADVNKGHGPTFWECFKTILKIAESCGIHNPIDYSKKPLIYCGKVYVADNPYFDNTVRSYI